MEDAYLAEILEDLIVFGVFDGHRSNFILLIFIQGQSVALFTKNHFTTILRQTTSYKSKDYKNALIEAFLGIDKKLESLEGKKELEEIYNSLQAKSPDPNYDSADPNDLAKLIGCTACVALITKTEIYVANAGDSRAVLSKSGIAINLSEDHKPELEKEKKRILKANGYVEDNRVNGIINLSRSLGDLEFKRDKSLPQEDQIITAYPDVRVEKISNETDFLIIGCDGVWDCMNSQYAVDYIKEKLAKNAFDKEVHKMSKILEVMLDSILATDPWNMNGIGCDNMTAVLVVFSKLR